MRINNSELGLIDQEQGTQEKERNQLPWVRKYLELADLLIQKADTAAPGTRCHAAQSQYSDAV
jgi:hypothetical protein